jgi:hypothetical protein
VWYGCRQGHPFISHQHAIYTSASELSVFQGIELDEETGCLSAAQASVRVDRAGSTLAPGALCESSTADNVMPPYG